MKLPWLLALTALLAHAATVSNEPQIPLLTGQSFCAHRSRGMCVCVCVYVCVHVLHVCIINETLMPVIGRKSCTRPTYQPLLAVRDSL